MMYGTSYGFAIMVLQSLGPHGGSISAVGGFVGAVLALILAVLGQSRLHADIRRITFIPAAIAILFLPISPPISYVACGIPIVATTIFTAATEWISVALRASQTKQDAVLLFAANKTPGWTGFFLGTLAGGAILGTGESLTFVVAAIAASMCISFTVFELNLFRESAEQPKDLGSLPETDASRELFERQFASRCAAIGARFGLSPREMDVFVLLAKGRNAEYISDTLCIARPTAKTHIQHIYQKLTINSQQELIEIVERSNLD